MARNLRKDLKEKKTDGKYHSSFICPMLFRA